MPAMNCKCGKTTNTAVASWVGSTQEDPRPIVGSSLTVLALECYVAWDAANQCWVPGCAQNIPVWMRSSVASLLRIERAE